MADTKISALTALTGANLAVGDLITLVDVSDTTMAASGTNKSIRADELLKGLANVGSAWNSWTPTITQSGALTKTVDYGAYIQIGKLVICQCRLALTSGGTTNNPIRISVPVTAASSQGYHVGVGQVTDASALQSYPGIVIKVSTTNFGIQRSDTIIFVNEIGQDPNFATASGDTVILSAMYEAA